MDNIYARVMKLQEIKIQGSLTERGEVPEKDMDLNRSAEKQLGSIVLQPNMEVIAFPLFVNKDILLRIS